MAAASVLEAASAELAELGVAVAGDELGFNLTTETGTAHFAARLNRHVTPATAGVVHELIGREAGPDVVLLTEHVSPETAEILRRLGQQFIDSVGNVYLRGDGLFIWQVGRPRRSPAPTESHASPALVRIEFVLLAEPSLIGRGFRAIAQASRTSIGSVQSAVRQLDERGHVVHRLGRRALVERGRLLDDWLPLYLRVLRPKLLLGRYVGEPLNWWTTAVLDPSEAQWGGDTGAFKLDGYLRPGLATVYADELPRALIRANRLKPASDHADRIGVEVRQRFWNVTDVPSDPTDVVPAVLVYADLLAATDGRSAEAAGRIRSGHLARLLTEE